MNGKHLKADLKELKLSQRDLAARLDVGENIVSRWATDRNPVPGYVVEYLRVLGLAGQIVGKQ